MSAQYLLKFDEDLADIPGAKLEAYCRMARCGKWHDGGWWESPQWQSRDDALKRIEREGFEIVKISGGDTRPPIEKERKT